MSDMIRSRLNDDPSAGGRRPGPIWILLGVIVALAAGITAAMNASTLGWPAFLLLSGIAAIALMTIFGLVTARYGVKGAGMGDDEIPTVVQAAFDALTEPSMITRDGKPVYANAAYFDLAERMGAQGLSQSPPSIDRIFGTKVKSASAIIFRLHHTRHSGERAEEYVETLDSAGKLIRFRVRVSGTEQGLLWQVKDISATGQEAIDALIQAPVGLFSVSPDGQVLAMNTVMRRWIGLDPTATIAKMSEFIESPDSLLGSPRTPGRIVRNDTRLITRKGIVTPAVMTGTWQELDSGEIFASVAVYGHSGALPVIRPPAPDAVDDAVAKVAGHGAGAHTVSGDTHGAAPLGIVRLDNADLQQAVILEANAALVGMCGGHVQTGDRFASMFAPGEATLALLDAEISDRSVPFDVMLAGDTVPVNVFISEDEMGCVAYLIDTSARKDLENQLFQSQKMQAIGQFAGGVAHDFNNLLTAIRLNTDELLGRHPVGDPSYGELLKINTTVTRAAALVKKLLQFSRKETQRTQALGVTDTLSDLTILLKQVLTDRVKLDIIHGRDLPAIMVDESQLETAMMNLIVNARDAMEDQGGGEITIKTAVASADELRARGPENLKHDKYVRIAVTDTGTGMDQATQDKIFEPFFTTKEVGKGTGLGLATVYGIMKQSGGHLAVESEVGVGTTFFLYLPATDKIPDSQSAAVIKAKAAPPKPADLAGQGTILFVEDEIDVRDIAAKTLRKRGYTVIEAGDGEEAFEILESGEHVFDLMVSDVVMPGMDGPTLLKKGRHLLGDARIVFISGYAQEEFSDILSEETDITFLPKPFTLLQLAQRVKQELS